MTQFETIKGAECWASYLINGDASGLTDREVALANHWLAVNKILDVVDCGQEPYFTWNYDLHTGDIMARGGNVLDYTVRISD